MGEQRIPSSWLVQIMLYARDLDPDRNVFHDRFAVQVPLQAGKSAAAHEYWSTVLHERMERHQASLPPAPERSVCDGWGLVTIASVDGPNRTACFGCRACAGGLVVQARAQHDADPFARLPQLPSDDELEM